MFGRFFGAFGLCILLGSAASAQVVTYYQPAFQPYNQPAYQPYYAPRISGPVTTYYAPAATYQPAPATTYYAPAETARPAAVTTYYAPAETARPAPVTTYYAPAATVYYAPPATPTRMNLYHSSVSSMPVGSVQSAVPFVAATPVPMGAPPVATLAPPVIAYRPVVAMPQSYIVTRGLFGRPHLYPVSPTPVMPVYIP